MTMKPNKLRYALARVMKQLKEKCQSFLNWIEKRATVVMAFVAVIMCISLFQNHEILEMARESLNQTEESLRITRESVELQRNEFKLRNRPYVVIKNYNFAGKTKSTEGILYPHSVKLDLVNLSEIPANQLKGFHRVVLNGKVIRHTPINQAALAKGGVSKAHVFLQEDTYSAAMNEKNTFKIVTELTYSGMLGEEANAYRTSETVFYSVPEKVFKYENAEYK